MKKLLVSVFTIAVLVVGPTAEAQTLSASERLVKLQEIQRLTEMLLSLQKQLAALTAIETGETEEEKTDEEETGEISYDIDDVYESRIYKKTFEAIYYLKDLGLVRVDDDPIRYGDNELWETYIDLIGEDYISEQRINEYRIFSDTRSSIGAFVENKPDGSWLIAVNRGGRSLTSRHDGDDMIELLLHESAHIIFFAKPKYQQKFEDKFWQGDDIDRHLVEVKNAADITERNELGYQFYDHHKSDFVTNYAATTPAEDIVESFVEFVTLDDKPLGSQLKNAKVRFFYDYEGLTKWRDTLRESGLVR